MRKIMLFCIFMVHALIMNAQAQIDCATPESIDSDAIGAYSGAIDIEFLNSVSNEPVVYNIFFLGD